MTIKLARLGNKNLYFPPTVRKREFYHFLTQIDPRDTGGGYNYVNPQGSHVATRVFSDWLQDHGDWRWPIAGSAAVGTAPAQSSTAPYPDYVAADGKRYRSVNDLVPPRRPYQYGLHDYLTTPMPDTNVYGTGFGERRGGRWGHAATSHISFRIAEPTEKGTEPALHVLWTHRVPGGKMAPGQTHKSATIHAIMTPEQILDLARNAPTDMIRDHLYHVLQQFKEHTGWKMKLARLADTRPFAAAHDENAKQDPYTQDETFNGALHDYLMDHDDPRADIVRQRKSWAAASTEAMEKAGADNPKTRNQVHRLSDGSELWMEPFGAGSGRYWGLGWTGPPGGAFSTLHGASMSNPEFLAWLNRFDGNERKSILKTLARKKYHAWKPVGAHPRVKLARPAAVIGSTQHRKKLEIARRILQEAGIKPATVKAVVADGDRAGVIQMLHDDTHPALARYVAAWFGLLTGEKSLTVFHPAANGEDFLHVISTRYPPDQLGKYLRDSGSPPFSVENTGTGSRAYVYNPLGKFDVRGVLKGLPDASHSEFTGFGSRIGGTSPGASSRAAYRTVIRDFDGTDTNQARQGSPDVHSTRLANTNREGDA